VASKLLGEGVEPRDVKVVLSRQVRLLSGLCTGNFWPEGVQERRKYHVAAWVWGRRRRVRRSMMKLIRGTGRRSGVED
jgi:hypothetical protein